MSMHFFHPLQESFWGLDPFLKKGQAGFGAEPHNLGICHLYVLNESDGEVNASVDVTRVDHLNVGVDISCGNRDRARV